MSIIRLRISKLAIRRSAKDVLPIFFTYVAYVIPHQTVVALIVCIPTNRP